MAELNVRIDLSFGARSLRLLMAAAMILAAADEVASESVTLTTYYPAPSGVYTQMITTGFTELARDGSCVDIGNSVVGCNGYELNITGSEYFSGNLGVGGGLTVNGTGTSPTGNPGGGLMVKAATTLGGGAAAANSILTVNGSATDKLVTVNAAGIVGTTYFAPTAMAAPGIANGIYNASGAAAAGLTAGMTIIGPTSVTGGLSVADYVYSGSHLVAGGSTGCSAQTISAGGGCGGGQYITNVGGVYAAYYALGFYTNYSTQGSQSVAGDTDPTDANKLTVLCCAIPANLPAADRF